MHLPAARQLDDALVDARKTFNRLIREKVSRVWRAAPRPSEIFLKRSALLNEVYPACWGVWGRVVDPQHSHVLLASGLEWDWVVEERLWRVHFEQVKSSTAAGSALRIRTTFVISVFILN